MNIWQQSHIKMLSFQRKSKYVALPLKAFLLSECNLIDFPFMVFFVFFSQKSKTEFEPAIFLYFLSGIWTIVC